jgi:hypothetical protein
MGSPWVVVGKELCVQRLPALRAEIPASISAEHILLAELSALTSMLPWTQLAQKERAKNRKTVHDLQ